MISLRRKPFAILCYRRRSVLELQQDLQGFANSEDCQAWCLTAHEWREQIKLALKARMENQPIG